jgi:predicted TIM-barrel enzyme
MTDLQNLKKIKYILEEEVLNRLFRSGVEWANVKEALLVVDKMIETKTKKRKTIKAGVAAAKSAARKAPKRKHLKCFLGSGGFHNGKEV